MLSIGELRKYISLNTKLEEVPIGSYYEYYFNFNVLYFCISSRTGMVIDEDCMRSFENFNEFKEYLVSKFVPFVGRKVEQLSLL